MTFTQIPSERAIPAAEAKAMAVPLEQKLAQMAELMARMLRRDDSEASNAVVSSIMALKRLAA